MKLVELWWSLELPVDFQAMKNIIGLETSINVTEERMESLWVASVGYVADGLRDECS
ncbi:MAG TPA: hypothetical protein VFC15_11550 [Candidatus Limnocylindrales bacterium]|nr:hypothetical protein [Candidatus Limnocylindrales bacterium]